MIIWWFVSSVQQGAIQQFLIIPDPQAADRLCEDYVPDCDMPEPRLVESIVSMKSKSSNKLNTPNYQIPSSYSIYTLS